MSKIIIKKNQLTLNKILQKVTKLKEVFWGNGFNLSSPEIIQIETTIRCNLRCTMCDVEMKNRTSKKDLSLDEFKKIINQLTALSEVNLTGYGEPLLNDNIFEMIKYAKKQDKYVYFSTNCTLLDKNKTRQILESGLDAIIFSIDSAIPNEYNKIRLGANYDISIGNVKYFMEQRNNLQSAIKVEIYSVVLFSKLNDVPWLIDLANNLGIEKIKLRGLVDHRGENMYYDKEALYHPDNRRYSEQELIKLKNYAEEISVILSYPPLSPVAEYQCRMPFLRPFISVEGFVTPCCVQGMNPRNVNFGNIHEESFKSIWNNEKIKKFRSELLSKTPPNMCKFCPRLKGMA